MATGTKIYTFLNKLTLYKETNKTTITKRILSEKEKKVKKRQNKFHIQSNSGLLHTGAFR